MSGTNASRWSDRTSRIALKIAPGVSKIPKIAIANQSHRHFRPHSGNFFFG